MDMVRIEKLQEKQSMAFAEVGMNDALWVTNGVTYEHQQTVMKCHETKRKLKYFDP